MAQPGCRHIIRYQQLEIMEQLVELRVQQLVQRHGGIGKWMFADGHR